MYQSWHGWVKHRQSPGFQSRKLYQKTGNFKNIQKTVLGIVAKKMHGKFQAKRMNGSMVSGVLKLSWHG